MLTEKEKIAIAEKNIRQALDDYWRHVEDKDIYMDINEEFIKRLAHDNTIRKDELRKLFRKSSKWDEELDAIIIDGMRTHEPDPNIIRCLGNEILFPAMITAGKNAEGRKINLLADCVNYFVFEEDKQYLNAINEIAPNAYAPGKKPSRVFKDICKALGIADEKAGSDFQKLYAKFADELSSKKIDFKLYLSLNPAHFLTMSNPKDDLRGETLVSCHSLNDTENSYNCGCSGYARDDITFIVFTAADPNNPENLNNRKTTRQLFMYEPGSGILLQSRMYNTSGGTNGVQELSRTYRNLVQKELSDLESVPNIWKKQNYCNNSYSVEFNEGVGFGGYADWMHSNFNATISVRNGCDISHNIFYVGNYGLCIKCGAENNTGLYCPDCKGESENEVHYCECCDSRQHGIDNIFTAHDYDGYVYVCESCLDTYFYACDICGEYHRKDKMFEVQGYDFVCKECLDEFCQQCDECGKWVKKTDILKKKDKNGNMINVCYRCNQKESNLIKENTQEENVTCLTG